jgi:hypothetical protein
MRRHAAMVIRNETHLPLEQYPPVYHPLIISQNQLGWNQVFRGRFSLLWSDLQQDFLQRNQWVTKYRNGRSWTSAASQHLMEQWLQLWELRNGERHGKDEITRNAILRARLHQDLTTMYSLRLRVLPRHRPLFHQSVEEHLQLHPDLPTLENWINSFKDAFIASAAEAHWLRIQFQSSLTAWLR